MAVADMWKYETIVDVCAHKNKIEGQKAQKCQYMLNPTDPGRKVAKKIKNKNKKRAEDVKSNDRWWK